jgi:hypothetical protein
VDGRVRSLWWPTLRNAEDAKKAAKRGAACALFVGLVTATIATLNLAGITNLLGLNAWAYVDAAIFLVLALFIYRLSRAAAISALALYALERVGLILMSDSHYGGGAVTILFVFMFVNAIRGTFAYRHFTASGGIDRAELLHAHA